MSTYVVAGPGFGSDAGGWVIVNGKLKRIPPWDPGILRKIDSTLGQITAAKGGLEMRRTSTATLQREAVDYRQLKSLPGLESADSEIVVLSGNTAVSFTESGAHVV